jgi:hypothetical protein
MTHSKENSPAGFRNAEENKMREKSETTENLRSIENHIKAAEHFALATKYHYEAARYHGEGDHERANQSAWFAFGHSCRATNYQSLDARQHTSETDGQIQST